MTGEPLPFERLWRTIASRIEPLGVERGDLRAAAARVLREPLRAAWDLPRFDAAAMDGFAVRASDCAGTPPFRLRLAKGDAYAGRGTPPPLAAGEALPIATGGVVPAGADAIAIKEIVRVEGRTVVVTRPVARGAHVRRCGEELNAGDELLPPGTILDPLSIAAGLAAGADSAAIGVRPRVAIVSTGSELVPPGEAPGPGQVIDTNLFYVERCLAGEAGAEVVLAARAPDDPGILACRLAEALDAADVVVTIGGVSVGDRDHVRSVLLDRFGAEPVVERVAQRPGKPLFVARVRGRWVTGLPGNPAAVVVHCALTVVPLLRALAGASRPEPPRLVVRLTAPIERDRTRTLLRWATLSPRAGALWATPLARSASHMLTGLARADALVILPPGEGTASAGTALDAVTLGKP